MLINPSAVKSRATPLLRPTTYQVVCNFNLVNVRLEFAIVALDYWNLPFIDITVVE